MRYRLLDEGLVDEISKMGRDEQSQFLFLDQSKDFKGRWSIDSLWPDWYFDFEDLVGSFRTISPAKLDDFLSLASALDYNVVFTDKPEKILEEYKGLSPLLPFPLFQLSHRPSRVSFPGRSNLSISWFATKATIPASSYTRQAWGRPFSLYPLFSGTIKRDITTI